MTDDEDAFLAELSRQIDECMAKIADPRWRIEDRTIARNLPPLEAKAACQPWCGRALPDDGVAVYGFIDGPGEEREFFKLSGARCRRKGYVLGWCSMECRDRAAQPAELPAVAIKVLATVNDRCPLCGVSVPATSFHLCSKAQPAEQPAPAKFEPPKCDRCPSTDGVRGHPVDGRYQYMCPPCIAAAVAWFSVQPGKSYKGPALIDRRLTHSPMWPDDDGGA